MFTSLKLSAKGGGAVGGGVVGGGVVGLTVEVGHVVPLGEGPPLPPVSGSSPGGIENGSRAPASSTGGSVSRGVSDGVSLGGSVGRPPLAPPGHPPSPTTS